MIPNWYVCFYTLESYSQNQKYANFPKIGKRIEVLPVFFTRSNMKFLFLAICSWRIPAVATTTGRPVRATVRAVQATNFWAEAGGSNKAGWNAAGNFPTEAGGCKKASWNAAGNFRA